MYVFMYVCMCEYIVLYIQREYLSRWMEMKIHTYIHTNQRKTTVSPAVRLIPILKKNTHTHTHICTYIQCPWVEVQIVQNHGISSSQIDPNTKNTHIHTFIHIYNTCGLKSRSCKITVSAAVKLIPSPPARVDSKKTRIEGVLL